MNDAPFVTVTCCAIFSVFVETHGVAVGIGVAPAVGKGAGVPYTVNVCVSVPEYVKAPEVAVGIGEGLALDGGGPPGGLVTEGEGIEEEPPPHPATQRTAAK